MAGFDLEQIVIAGALAEQEEQDANTSTRRSVSPPANSNRVTPPQSRTSRDELAQHHQTQSVYKPSNNERPQDNRRGRRASELLILEELDTIQESPLQNKKRPRFVCRLFARGLKLAACTGAGITTFICKYQAPKVSLLNCPLWKWGLYVTLAAVQYWTSGAVIRLVATSLESRFTTTKQLVYWLMGTQGCVHRFISSAALLVCFCLICSNSHSIKGWAVLLRVHICLILFCFANLSRTFAAKSLSTTYHRQTHFVKLQQAIFKEYILAQLLKPPSTKLGANSRTRRTSTLCIDDIPSLQLMPTAELDLNIQLYQIEKHVRTSELKGTLSQRLVDETKHNGGTSPLDFESKAKQTALYLFWKLCRDVDRDHLTAKDITPYIPSKLHEKAIETLDVDGNGQISLDELKINVRQIYQERQNLARTLVDADTILGTLRLIFGAVFHTVFFFIYLMIFEANVTKVWLTFSSLVLVFSFVFGVSLRNLYENVIFLFFVHPYDIGDCVLFEVNNSDSFTVESMSIMTTRVRKSDNTKGWYPNTKLSQLPIFNVTRSGSRSDSFKVCLDIGTPHSTFMQLQTTLETHVGIYPKDFESNCSCYNVASQDPLKIIMQCSFTYNFPPSESTRLSRVRHGLFMAISDKLAEIEANYTSPAIAEVEKQPETKLINTATAISKLLKPELLKSE